MHNCFSKAFDLNMNPHNRQFFQDRDPSQKSSVSKDIMGNLGTKMVSIPARSPNINCIENLFHLVGISLVADTKNKNITKVTFDKFSARV